MHSCTTLSLGQYVKTHEITATVHKRLQSTMVFPTLQHPRFAKVRVSSIKTRVGVLKLEYGV